MPTGKAAGRGRGEQSSEHRLRSVAISCNLCLYHIVATLIFTVCNRWAGPSDCSQAEVSSTQRHGDIHLIDTAGSLGFGVLVPFRAMITGMLSYILAVRPIQ